LTDKSKDGRRAVIAEYDSHYVVCDGETFDIHVVAFRVDDCIRLNIDYYSHDLGQDFHESVDLPLVVIRDLARELKRIGDGAP